MTDDIVWAAPPDTAKVVGAGDKPGRYVPFARALAQRQGEWAILPSKNESQKGAEGTAQNIRRGKVKGFEEGIWETALDGLTIYVRYMGPRPARPAAPKKSQPQRSNSDALSARIRQWGRDRGYPVPDRGRLPESLIAEYQQSQGKNGLALVGGDDAQD